MIFLLDDVVKYHPRHGMAVPFQRGDLLVVGPGMALQVGAAKIGRGPPPSAQTALVRFASAETLQAQQQWWALGKDPEDPEAFAFWPVDRTDTSIVVGSRMGPFRRVLVVGEGENLSQRQQSAMVAASADATAQLLWERSSADERRRLARRQMVLDACREGKDRTLVRMQDLLDVLGSQRDFEQVTTRTPGACYLSGELSGVVLCGGAAVPNEQRRTLLLSLRVQTPEEPEDEKAEHFRVSIPYLDQQRLGKRATEVLLLSAAHTACPVDDPLALIAPLAVGTPVKETMLALPEAERSEVAEALIQYPGSPVASPRAAASIWQALDPGRRERLWVEVAGENPGIRNEMIRAVRNHLDSSEAARLVDGGVLQKAFGRWEKLSTLAMLELAAQVHDLWLGMEVGLQSLGALVRMRNRKKFGTAGSEAERHARELSRGLAP